MKKNLFILALGLFLNFYGLQGQQWLDFQAANCLCKVQFPAHPELEEEQMEDYKSHRAIAHYEDGVYFLDYGIHTKSIGKKDSEMIAEKAIEGASNSLGATILKRKKWKINGWDGLRMTMEVPSEGWMIYYNTVMVRNIHYQIFYIGSGDTNKRVVDRFLNSFKLI